MYVKVCGLSTVESARAALDAGADAIGVVMSPKSPRHVSVDTARELCAFVGDDADRVLVVNRMPASDAVDMAREIGADVVQLHGSGYTEADFAAALPRHPRLWRAISWDGYIGIPVGAWGEETLLLDSPKPGSGVTWDLSRLRDGAPSGRWLLAGGLSPENVASAIAEARPWGVDVSSGVESAPGVKDHALIHAFVTAARGAG